MYNLLRFFLRYYLFILFISLECFCFYLTYRTKKYNQAAYNNFGLSISGKVHNSYTGITDYLYLRKMSDSLVNENAALRQRLIESKFDNKVDSAGISDSAGRYIQHYTYLTARVIYNSVDQASNLIYLNRGKLQGISRQMGVFNANGIVGQVISVTDNYAAVMSVLSKDFKVSAKLKKSEYFGNMHWDGINSTTATLEEIPKHVPVKPGDTIVTSGFSELFPRNIMIGTVKKVKTQADKNFLEITVNLSTDFGNLSYVYIVKNIRRNELQLLDSLSKKND
jgi:rod shape-determining protein MreC